MHPEAIITKICNAIDQLIESSEPYKGLFPSILHPQTGEMLMEKPPKIPGQRDGDRAHLGSNLMHDEPLLVTMNTLAESQSKPEYTEAVDRYLKHFAQNCTNTATGLFPESAALLGSRLPELAAQMWQYGLVYIDGFLAAPHNLETREFVSLCECETHRIFERMSTWGSVYGAGTACSTAVLCIGGWRLTQNEKLMEWARVVGNTYLDEKFPVARVHTEGFKIPASDAGLTLELFADLYDITGESVWLEGGIELSETVLEVYFPETLPFGASGIDWYESQMEAAYLIHGLARVALLALSRTCPLAPNYTAR